MRRYGLRAQVIIYTLLPTILIGGGLAAYFTFHRFQQANDYLINFAINITEPLAITSEYGMQDDTRTILRRVTGATHRKNSRIIKSLTIFDADNHVFVTSNYHRGFEIQRLPDGVEIPKYTTISYYGDNIIVRTPIIAQGDFLQYQLTFDNSQKILGYVALEVNHSSVELLLYRDIVFSCSIVFLGILCSLYFAFRQAQRITAPISKMVSVVENISLGRLNSRVEGVYTGEINALQQGINEMALAMSKHHKEMQESIDLATSELRETLDQMEIQNIELDLTRKKAQQAAQVKSEFLANMSHELRTPLNGVIGFARQLLKTKMSSHQLDYLETIERSAANLLNIINDILDFSKIEAGKLLLEKIPFDLRDCVDETMALLAPSAHEKNLELSVFIDVEVTQSVLGDTMRLQQILTNLVGNAIKFTQQGNIEVKIQQLADKNNIITLKISITDTGIGISKAQHSQIFRAFEQADSSITRQYGGTGLGLVITQELIHKMHGKIHFDSIENQGSTFWFTIKLKKNSSNILSFLSTKHLQNSNILVFEQNEPSARACQLLLSQWGSISTIVSTDKQWIKSLHKNYESIVIGHSNNADIPALLTRIDQAQDYTKNVIVLINSNNISLYEHLKSPSVSHCLCKPINHKNFANALLENQHKKPRLNLLKKHKCVTREYLSVLAVDDNPANLKLISVMLKDIATHIVTCVDGLEAVEIATKEKFDLIFMDIQMPRLDGINACSLIKKESKNKKTPIIAVTAHAYPEEKEQFLQQGMDDCLAKPIDERALKKIIQRWFPKNIENEIKTINTQQTENKNMSFNWILAVQQSAGKEDLAKEMLILLLDEFPNIKKSTQNFIRSTKQQASFTKIIHKFHGGCSYSGVPRLIKIIKEIEKGLHKNQTKEQLMPELLELLDELENVKNAIPKRL
ncbi:two-component sensor histidine kinase BarA [Psychromonas sp. CD1]|uniref:two-component sensor histidine kinase BarA n=1 Tax=Psychromonas sp. CD1 TaxID=1979839 RepID=UPI000B9B93F1|nr:two-component sensor histidine kinase BarA [Psychromonas sp. CD1]